MRKKIESLSQKQNAFLILIFLCFLVAFPVVVNSGFFMRVVVFVFIYAILSMSSMLILGYGGMLNIGHVAFYGLGAYTSTLLSVNFGVPFIVCFVAAGIVGAIFGLVLAIPCLRVAVDFLSLITLAFLQLFVAVATNWYSLTKGPLGIAGVPSPSFFGFRLNTQIRYYYLALIAVVICYIVLKRLVKSPFGRALEAIRDDEIAARAVGIDVNRYKVEAFAIGSAIAGLAGSLMVHYIRFVGPTMFTIETSLLVMQMNILGGLGSLVGAIFGAAFFVIVPEIIRPLAVYRMGLGGVIMLLVILIRPQGVFGSIAFAGDGGILDKRIAALKKLRAGKRQSGNRRER